MVPSRPTVFRLADVTTAVLTESDHLGPVSPQAIVYMLVQASAFIRTWVMIRNIPVFA